jgi:hypothetical protein
VRNSDTWSKALTASGLRVDLGLTTMPDPTSQSNYLQISTEHVYFDWNVDFQQKVISGSAVHNLIVKQDGVREVV